MNLNLFPHVGTQAVLASMAVIRPRQCGIADIGASTLKPFDRSLLTKVDTESESAGTAIFRAAFPDVPILREESGWSTVDELARYVIFYDPVDGTRPLVAGAPTSTVIATLFDRRERRIIAAIIGEPATGRVWTAVQGLKCLRSCYIDGERAGEWVPVSVWSGRFDSDCTIMTDNFNTFSRAGKTILTNAGCVELVRRLQSKVAIQNYGSNGLHHALVANGNQRAVGAITTSMGGPWDGGGALLVLEAGGEARALSIDAARCIKEVDPLDPTGYDLLVVANNDASCSVLLDALTAALKL